VKLHLLPQEDQTNGWSLILPERLPRPSLQSAIKVQWLVLGAGYAGLAAARRLAQLNPSADIALIDAGTIGNNASGRNSGFAIDVPHNVGSSLEELAKAQQYQRLLTAGIERLQTLVVQHRIECQWNRAGKYHCAVSAAAEKTLRAHVRELHALHEPFTWYEREALASRLGTHHYRSGIYTPGCILLNPAALCRGLADALPDSVTLYENSPVLELNVGSNKVVARTASGTITANALVLANNGFAQQLGIFKPQTFPMSTYASLSAPLTDEQRERYGVANSWGMTPANAIVGATMRYTDDHRILIRHGFVYSKSFRISPAQRQAAQQVHRQIFNTRFAQISDVALEHFWVGTISMTRNGAPWWGKVAPNVFAVVGCNGVGIVKQTILGELLMDFALGQDNALIADVQALGRPNALPPRPFMDLGLKAYISKENYTGRHEF